MLDDLSCGSGKGLKNSRSGVEPGREKQNFRDFYIFGAAQTVRFLCPTDHNQSGKAGIQTDIENVK